ncbi:MAG: leucyl/phenylalanyl-tRNA--protein transferase [Betaproteobacteria bacterium]|nr:leucyl/phenylalanyl-tRNA--protein transferase [Betaproteobacteria bacterium]
MIPWLQPGGPFPPVERALSTPNGLLAAGGDLSPERLLAAYRLGIFPWYPEGEPILWWSPDPRMVLFPAELRVSRSLAKALRNRRYEIRFDTAFEPVMRACAAPRDGQSGTWISAEMINAYAQLHRLGWAHSVETWIDGELAGGLYGMAIGRAFFGESMFSRARDASKIALVHLARHLAREGCGIIDCQMRTPHLASMGAREIPRALFAARLRELVHCPDMSGPWSGMSTDGTFASPGGRDRSEP